MSAHGEAAEPRLPPRDWLLQPLIFLLTIGLILVSAEAVARRSFSSWGSLATGCFVGTPDTNGRVIPNSVCTEKYAEAAPTEYRFNSCGHRAGVECAPKPAGTYRIVLIGTSTAMGFNVPREKSFAALLPAALSRQTGRRIEVYNEGSLMMTPVNLSGRFNELLAAQPDLILWVLMPLDIGGELQSMARHKTGKDAPAGNPVAQELLSFWNGHLTSVMLQHLLYQSRSQYVKSFLARGDDAAGFLNAEYSPAWQGCVRRFTTAATQVEAQSQAAGVPLVVTLVPQRAQAAMISTGEWPASYNPFRLGDEVRSALGTHGAIYIDLLRDYRAIPNPERSYLPVDGHPDAPGHAVVSELLTRELTSGIVPDLTASQPQVAPR
jgi:hypothetical protein